MSRNKRKKLQLKFILIAPFALLIYFISTDNRIYKRAIGAIFIILGFILIKVAVLIPFKTAAGILTYIYFFAVMPFVYYGLLKDYISPDASKAIGVLLAIATMFAAMAATSGL